MEYFIVVFAPIFCYFIGYRLGKLDGQILAHMRMERDRSQSNIAYNRKLNDNNRKHIARKSGDTRVSKIKFR